VLTSECAPFNNTLIASPLVIGIKSRTLDFLSITAIVSLPETFPEHQETSA